MRNLSPILILTVALSLVLAETASAKPGEGPRGRRGDNAGERGGPRGGGPRGGGPRGGGPRGGGPLLGAIDQDRDGDLSASEIAQASVNLAKLDADGDGVVTRRELERAGGERRGRGSRGERGQRPGARGKAGAGERKGKQGRNPQAMLDRADTNGDGVITKSEAPERMLERWDRVDANGDGEIDKAEQAQVIERMEARMREGGRRPKD